MSVKYGTGFGAPYLNRGGQSTRNQFGATIPWDVGVNACRVSHTSFKSASIKCRYAPASQGGERVEIASRTSAATKRRRVVAGAPPRACGAKFLRSASVLPMSHSRSREGSEEIRFLIKTAPETATRQIAGR